MALGGKGGQGLAIKKKNNVVKNFIKKRSSECH